MSRIPVFVEKSPRKNWNKRAETCIFIARESVKTSSEVDDLIHDTVQTVSNNSMSVSVVSCVKGVVNRSCCCPDCKEISEISTKSRTKDGVKESFIPIKDNGVKSFGWNGSKLTPAKSILTPAPVKVKSKFKTKTKLGDIGVIPSKVLAPAKSSQSPQRAFRSAFKVIANNDTGLSSKQTGDKLSHDRVRKGDSRPLTSLDYEDSEPECFQHEIRTRLPSDSPASVKGLKNSGGKKRQQKPSRLESFNFPNGVESESKSLTGSYDGNKGSHACTRLELHSKKPELNLEECRKLELNTSNLERFESSKNVDHDSKKSNHDVDNDQILPQEEADDDKSFSDQTLDEISSIHTTVVEKFSDSQHLEAEVADVKSSDISARNGHVDDSGHVTCVISSPPSGRAAKVVNDHVTSKNRQNAVGTIQKSSKLPLFYKRKLPKPPSEVRTIKYGQKVIQENKENHLETCKKPKGIEGIAKIKRTTEALTTKHLRENVYKQAKPPTSTRSNGNANSSMGPGAAATANGGGGSKKRPAWDLKGRLQDMETKFQSTVQERHDLMTQMNMYNERIVLLENKNTQLSGTVQEKEQHSSSVSMENDSLRKQLRETEDDLHSVKRQFERETESFEFTKASLRRQKESLEGEITALQQEVSGLKASVAQLTSAQAGLAAELDATKLLLEQSQKDGREKDAEILRLRGVIGAQESTIEEFNVKFREHETVRRQLHNTIQELKGNIRVFCRVRPLVGEELYGSDGEIQHMNFPDEDQKVLELEKLGDVSLSESVMSASRRGQNKYDFAFDRVFQPTSTQEDVFDEISQLVQSALDGYNVCIFAYGQTGSGKTYTMEGPSVEDEENRGMIARAVLQIFNNTQDLEEKGWQYEFEGSFLEIYNETIRDLLGQHSSDVKHEIKLTGTGSNDVTVSHLTTVPVTSDQQIKTLLKTAATNRAVGETLLNERSSRSHSVFRLKLSGANEITGEKSQGTLNLIDLAGSERLKDSGATGQRLKETQNINKSLANLGNVIMALANKDSHVPYRNSKLTYLLQNSLGGNSKTLMFVNVSPREEHFGETLNSLRFATKVNQCNIGTATKKVK